MPCMKSLLVLPTTYLLVACGGGSAPSLPDPVTSDSITIAEIQGTGTASPFENQTVTTMGIVTGDFQDIDVDNNNNLGGFYIQQETPDSDAATSDGIFVFDGSNAATDVNTGDRVTVVGTVAEYFGETQIAAITVNVIGRGTIPATDVNFPAATLSTNSLGDKIADLERFEGMLVRFPQELTVSTLRFIERFGEVGLSQGGRLYQYTNSNPPDTVAYTAHLNSVAGRSIILDDGMRSFYPVPIQHLHAGVPAGYSIRAGDTVTGITGNLRYSRSSGANGDEGWRLMPTESVSFDNANPRPAVLIVNGAIHVASLNVNNFFSNVDSGQALCGPQGDDRCRGADSAEELIRQLAKIASALALMDADIVGLAEIENNASASLQMIVDALNTKIGGSDYAYLRTGTIHDDAIKTGFIYKTSTVRLSGEFAILDSSVDTRFDDGRNRPALAQTFQVNDSGALVTVIVNHLKSKGSACDASGDSNLNDGQANCNLTRTRAAAAIGDWIATDPTNSGDSDFLIIGDLNSYTFEDPLSALKNAGLVSLLEANVNSYSYLFDAQAGALDHAVASASLAMQVAAIREWHINADEPALLDYNLENGRDPALFDPDSPYRTSDHDPVIVGLDLVN